MSTNGVSPRDTLSNLAAGIHRLSKSVTISWSEQTRGATFGGTAYFVEEKQGAWDIVPAMPKYRGGEISLSALVGAIDEVARREGSTPLNKIKEFFVHKKPLTESVNSVRDFDAHMNELSALLRGGGYVMHEIDLSQYSRDELNPYLMVGFRPDRYSLILEKDQVKYRFSCDTSRGVLYAIAVYELLSKN